MRKSILTILLVAICILGYTQKGTVLLNGNLFLNSHDYYGSKATSFSIKPGIGYQVADKWTLGLNLGFERTALVADPNRYSFGPYVRYTKQINELISVYGQLQTSFGRGDSARYFSLTIFPAIEFNLGKGFALNLNLVALNYEYTKFGKRSGSYSLFHTNIGGSGGFGISKRFGTKK